MYSLIAGILYALGGFAFKNSSLEGFKARMFFSSGNVIFGLLYYGLIAIRGHMPKVDRSLIKEVLVDCVLNLLGGYAMILAFQIAILTGVN